MENPKTKHILARQKLLLRERSPQEAQVKDQIIKMKYSDFNLTYNTRVDPDFDDMLFLAQRIEEYRAGQKVRAILLEKDFIKVFLVKHG